QAYVSYLNHRCLTRSTLFPYTTLFRSSLFKNADFVLMFATIGLILVLLMIIYRSPLLAVIPLVVAGMVYMVTDRVIGMGGDNGRSEEHTSELQSRFDLVCRLLLENKKL